MNEAVDKEHRSGIVAIVGRPNVGKSTFFNAALGQRLAIESPVAQTTRDRLVGVVRREGAELVLLDTPGIRRPRSRLGRVVNRTARDAAREADVVLYMTVAQSGVHPGDRTLLADIGASRAAGPPMRGEPAADDPGRLILVVNKVDRVHDKRSLLPLIEELGRIRRFAAVVPISALKADGIGRVLDEAARLVPVGSPRFAADVLTDRPVRFLAAELVREQVLLATRQEVPYAVAVQIDSFEEAEDLTRIRATIHVEREGQKGILIGRGGSQLKVIGTKARERIEELIGRKAYLSLFVRVTPGWTDSAEALAELGYAPR